MTLEEQMKHFSYADAIKFLKTYTELTEQALPAFHDKDKKTVANFNTSVKQKLKLINA